MLHHNRMINSVTVAVSLNSFRITGLIFSYGEVVHPESYVLLIHHLGRKKAFVIIAFVSCSSVFGFH